MPRVCSSHFPIRCGGHTSRLYVDISHFLERTKGILCPGGHFLATIQADFSPWFQFSRHLGTAVQRYGFCTFAQDLFSYKARRYALNHRLYFFISSSENDEKAAVYFAES